MKYEFLMKTLLKLFLIYQKDSKWWTLNHSDKSLNCHWSKFKTNHIYSISTILLDPYNYMTYIHCHKVTIRKVYNVHRLVTIVSISLFKQSVSMYYFNYHCFITFSVQRSSGKINFIYHSVWLFYQSIKKSWINDKKKATSLTQILCRTDSLPINF